MIPRQLRFQDLKELGIVESRPQLKNIVEKRGFPRGKLIGPNTRTYDEPAIAAWLNSRPTDPKPAPRRKQAE